MESEEGARTALAKQVTLLLQHPEATQVFPALLPDGSRQVLVALSDDELGPLFRRLRTFGGPVNVAVRDGDELAVIVFTPAPAEHVDEGADCMVNRKSAVGMLVSLLKATAGPVHCKLVPHCEAELIERVLTVPG